MNDRINLSELPKLADDCVGTAFSGTYCPKCLKDNLKKSHAVDGNKVGALVIAVRCLDCNNTWANVYSLMYWVDLNHEVKL